MVQKGKSSSSQNTFLDTIATRFDGIHSNFVLGNAQAPGWPIVYCSDGFCELTGFSRAHVMAKGSGCKFLYGPETEEEETAKIMSAIKEKRELKTELKLYRKNGTPFWCLLDIVPIKNEKRDVVLFLVSHKDISKQKDKQDKQHDKQDGAREESKDGDAEESVNKDSDKEDSSDDDDSDDDDAKDDDMPKNYDYGRRRSRAVLYHISGQLNKQNKAKSKLQQLNMLASQMPEYKVQDVKKSSFVIVHYGIFKIGWDWLILLCTVYIAIMVPFNAAFRKFAQRDSERSEEGRFEEFMYIDAGVEVLFAIDIVLNFRTTYVNKSGQVVYESRLIAIKYISGWFVLDLLAAIPFDLLYVLSVKTATMVHLLKVARLLRLARLLQKLERYNQYSVLVLALLMCMFALVAHWGACIWYAIGKAELEDSENRLWTTGWLYELSERLDLVIVNKTHNIPDMMTCYITALYFTCSSLTSVGFGNVSANTNAEKIFSVCAMLVGSIMYAAVFGNVTTIIQRMYARRATFHSKTKDLKDFFRIHHFPRPLKHRMRDYFQAMWSINNGIDFKQILKDFPEDMRGEIGLHLHREILSLPIFQQAPPGCLKGVALQTERLVCGPGEFIMHKGDAVNYLYYVCSGSMEVLKQEQVVAILGKGDIFGTDLDYDDPVSVSGCDVRSLAYCELLCIQVKGLVESLLLYPDYAETFNTELPNDLTYNVREGHEDHSDDESSTAAPVITLPSISEDEEEEDDKHNNNDDDVVCKERPTRLPNQRDSEDEEGGGTPMSPLLSHFSREYMSSADWLASRGRLPNGHIGNAIRTREDASPLPPSLPPSTPTTPATPTQAPASHASMRRLGQAGGSSSPHSSLALRRQAAARERNPHRRSLDKLKARTLPTLNSVATERSVEQVMVHTLQMELEGTRDTVIGLERRLDDLHEDLSNISRNVSSLLRMVSQSPCPSMYMSNVSLLPGHLQGNMAASGQLHPGYSYNNMAASCSPSPNPSSMYQTPTFYFSESTDGENSGPCGGPGLMDGNSHMTDARDNVSLFSGSNCSPMPPPDIGNFQASDHHGPHGQRSKAAVENYLTPHLRKGSAGGSRGSMAGIGTGGFSSPSPLHSPRVNFTPSPMSSHFPTFPKTPASPSLSRTLADRGGPPPASSGSDNPSRGTLGRLQSPTVLQPQARRAQTPDHMPSSSTFHTGNPATSAVSPQNSSLAHTKDLAAAGANTPDRVKPSGSFPSPKPRRSQSPRPSNLSPLQPRFPKPAQKKFTRASYPGGSSASSGITMSPLALELNFPNPVSTSASNTTDYTTSPGAMMKGPVCRGSPLLGNAGRAQEFQDEYYTLTQLQPCDGSGIGVCQKGSALRKSEQDLARSSLSRSGCSLHGKPSRSESGDDSPVFLDENDPSSHSPGNNRVKDDSLSDRTLSSSPQGVQSYGKALQSPTQHHHRPHNLQQQQQQHPQRQLSSKSKTPSPSSSTTHSTTTPSTMKASPSNKSRSSQELSNINRSPVPQHPALGSALFSSTTTPTTKAKRPQSLSPSSLRLQNSPQTGSSSCSPPDLDFIDSQPTKTATISQAAQQTGVQSSARRCLPSSSGNLPSTGLESSTKADHPSPSGGVVHQSPVASTAGEPNGSLHTMVTLDDKFKAKDVSAPGCATGNEVQMAGRVASSAVNAPLSKAESASDLDDKSPI